jgi:hypothetical protein
MDATDFETKRTKALELLKASGMRRNNYEPPLVSLLWKLGFPVPPPHFASFLGCVAFAGILFGVVWGLVMWFTTWSGSGMDLHAAILVSAVSGLLFGAAMAGMYAYGRRKHKLPAWDAL